MNHERNPRTNQKINSQTKLHKEQTETNLCTFISIQPKSSMIFGPGVTFTEIVQKLFFLNFKVIF